MGSLPMMKPSLWALPSSCYRELSCFASWEFDRLGAYRKGTFITLPTKRKMRNGVISHRICCKLQDNGDFQSNSSDEPPESLFMKELRRRGISRTSLLEESFGNTTDEEMKEQGGDRSYHKRNTMATGFDKSLTNQREQSMALNSEGLEGLIPRAKVLLTLGGTFFLPFWPLILVTAASFTALYLYFGPTFVHGASKTSIALPQYVDPYILLQEERMAE